MKLGATRWIATGAGAGLLALALSSAISFAQGPMSGDDGTRHPAHIHVGTCDNLDGSPLFPLADVVIPAPMGGGQMGMPDGDAAMASPAMGDMASPTMGDMASPVMGEDMATPMTGMGMGSAGAVPAGQSTTVVPVALADLLAADHAINIHLSYVEVQTYVACGAIGGTVDANSNLFVGLAEQNASGYAGVAWLHDNGDGTTTVTVFLTMHGGHMMDGEAATPEATPM